MTPHPTGSHVRLSPSPKGEGRKTTRLRVASNRRADWQVVLCARGARASSQGLCPPRLWRHEPQAKYNEEPPAKLVGSFFLRAARLWARRARLQYKTSKQNAALERRRFLYPLRDDQSALKGRSAATRARLIAVASSRWCFAQVPVMRRGRILPPSLMNLRSLFVSL